MNAAAQPNAARAESEAAPQGRVLPISLVDAAGATAGMTGFLVATLYYFGWAFTKGYYEHFGVSVAIITYDTTEFVLRSIRPVFDFLIVGLSIYAAAHQALRTRASRRFLQDYLRFIRVTLVVFTTLGLVLHLADILSDVNYPIIPLALMVSLAALGLVTSPPWTDSKSKTPMPSKPSISQFTLYGLLLLMIFWYVGSLAAIEGRSRAYKDRNHPEFLPQVTLVTNSYLDIPGLPATRKPSQPEYSNATYVYRNLRVLTSTHDSMLLAQTKGGKISGVTSIKRDLVVSISFDASPEGRMLP